MITDENKVTANEDVLEAVLEHVFSLDESDALEFLICNDFKTDMLGKTLAKDFLRFIGISDGKHTVEAYVERLNAVLGGLIKENPRVAADLAEYDEYWDYIDFCIKSNDFSLLEFEIALEKKGYDVEEDDDEA